MRTLSLSALLLLALVPALALAERPYVAIEQRLTAEQMQATGLNQLDAEQLALLNRLLSAEQTAVASETRAAERERKKSEAAVPVTSTLKGDFRGWQNGTVFELANGQRWRVTDGAFSSSRPLSNPRVTVKPGFLGSWYMLVEGTSVQAKVKRVDLD